MTELPLDLDSVLAHLVPGFIALAGIGFLYPRLQRFFVAFQEQRSGSALVALTLAALVVGLLLSDLRVALLHSTVRCDLRWICREPSFGPIPKEVVEYGKLTEEGHLHAFQEAKRSEQTPYRFHGNTLIAVAILVSARIIALCRDAARGSISRRHIIKGIALSIFVLVGAIAMLYPAFRIRYFNYVSAIKAISSE